jgi:hypothetical protein
MTANNPFDNSTQILGTFGQYRYSTIPRDFSSVVGRLGGGGGGGTVCDFSFVLTVLLLYGSPGYY